MPRCCRHSRRGPSRTSEASVASSDGSSPGRRPSTLEHDEARRAELAVAVTRVEPHVSVRSVPPLSASSLRGISPSSLCGLRIAHDGLAAQQAGVGDLGVRRRRSSRCLASSSGGAYVGPPLAVGLCPDQRVTLAFETPG